jgi:DNA polymerase-1
MNQIPKRDAEGREKMGLVPYAKQIRYAFLADEGESYLSCDYSQLEMKVAAYLSEDENMIADLSHTDFHAATAAGMFGKAVEDVTAEERAKGKTQNFAVLYRQSDASTAFSLKITEEEAKRSRLRYEDRYSKLTKFMQSNVDNVQKRGWVETFWGNRGRYPFIPDYGILAEMQRQAANLPVQGTAFYICALSAVRIHNEFDPKDLRVVMTIHDEINSLCRDEILTESAARVKEIMENPPYLEDRGVKFSADMKIRKRWAEI